MNFSTIIANTASDENASGGSFVFTLVFMALIGAAMYFLMIRPQRRRMRETTELQRSIGEGDEVITNAGIYGFVNAIDGDTVWLEVADDVEIRVSRGAITRKINPTQEPAGGETSSEASSDADGESD